ncbi:uncharacterized protein LOC106655934 [Trichogramma pretiosum]|uniref:uncharacterized protein LOC106655934 n=1 Tax=Trichogramma pretiosum TaxID=7493 RepID=UPI0006C98297|nr:uncharacterized protein LOC106655934 [Trichogramma pretiosum]
MESFVPVAIVQNLLQADEAHRDCGPRAALERVRRMMRELGPESPDPVDELLGQLCAKIQEIDGRSAQLHDKIKCVDERLLKGRDELSNLEKSNRELEQQIQQTELELERQASIGTITSADRAGIARMRRLAEEAVRTKRNIRALEARQALMLGRVEAVFRSGNARCYRLCENNVAAASSRPKHHVYRPKLKKKRCIQKNRSREFWPNASCHSCCHGVKDHHHHHRVVEYVESKSAQVRITFDKFFAIATHVDVYEYRS